MNPNKSCIVCDLQGTISDTKERDAKLAQNLITRDEWWQLAGQDPVHMHVVWLLMSMRALPNPPALMITTWAPNTYRARTEQWLIANGINPDFLLMRPATDPSSVEQWTRKTIGTIRRDGMHIMLAIDDNPKIAAIYQDAGIPCITTANQMQHTQATWVEAARRCHTEVTKYLAEAQKNRTTVSAPRLLDLIMNVAKQGVKL